MNNRYLNKIINSYNTKLKQPNIYGGSIESNNIINLNLETENSEQCDNIDLILQKIIPDTIKLDLPTVSETETLTFFLYNMLSEEDNINIYSHSLLDHILFNNDQKLPNDFFKNY
jgi:hypothetical protein